MKILVLGGYGIFGGRLCEILAANAEVTLFVAGRSLDKAKELSRKLTQGAIVHAALIDRDGDLHSQLNLIRSSAVKSSRQVALGAPQT